MGDTIVKGIADLTLSIGNFTVLPNERGVRANLKETMNRVTLGKFGEEPPGLLGESKRSKKGEENTSDGHHQKNDPESAAQRVAGDKAGTDVANAAKKGEGNDELPKSRGHYHLVLVKEIGKVMKHLNSSPPRKYTFDEWAWYLKLIGEDESDAETHRRAKGKPRPDGEGMGAALDGKNPKEGSDEDEVKHWSWVGNRSPLMGNKEESEWVLERLTQRLRRELETVRREEERGNEDEGNEGKREMVTHGFMPRESWKGGKVKKGEIEGDKKKSAG